MRKCVTGLAGAILGVATGIGAACAEGAIAAGVPADVSRDGVALFTHVQAATRARAEEEALRGCRNLQNAAKQARELCKVVATFSDQCAALSLDPEAGTPGWGWAIADTAEEARTRAIANCRERAGPTRQNACVVNSQSLWCDGRARR